MAANSYQDPNVYVTVVNTPVLAPIGVSPTMICLVGDSLRYTISQDTFQLSTSTPYQLSQLGINASTIVVTDKYTGYVWELTTDYTVTTHASTDGNAADTTTTITTPAINPPSGGGAVGSGWLIVSYQFTNANFYQPLVFSSYNALQSFYGSPFDSAGGIQSPLSLAGYLAFANGAPQVMALSVKAAASTPTAAEYATAFNQLSSQGEIDVIVPVDGRTTVHSNLQLFIGTLELSNIFTRGFVAQDSTQGTVPYSNIPLDGGALTADTRMVVVMPTLTTFNAGLLVTSNSNNIVQIGGQYVAAALAGLFAGQSGVQVPITRKTVSSLYNLPNQFTPQQIVGLQAAGVTCVYQDRTGLVYVKQGLTTDMSNFLNQEISVMAAQDKLYILLEDTLINQGLIGGVLTPTTVSSVGSAVQTALLIAMSSGLIQGFTGLQWTTPTNEPTTVQCTFQYLPTLPLNYIQVQFGIDINTGSAVFSTQISNLPVSGSVTA